MLPSIVSWSESKVSDITPQFEGSCNLLINLKIKVNYGSVKVKVMSVRANESESEESDITPKFEGSRNLLINLKVKVM